MLAAIVDPLPLSLAAVAQPAGRGQSLVLITLRDLSATSDSAASHLMDLFGLTAAEAGIVPQLLAGDSVSLIAQSRGVAVSTVKAQAAKVLAKTGAANLRALATMIAALGCG
jgi:DNA-binding NarL/FixJ family response regulator